MSMAVSSTKTRGGDLTHWLQFADSWYKWWSYLYRDIQGLIDFMDEDKGMLQSYKIICNNNSNMKITEIGATTWKLKANSII